MADMVPGCGQSAEVSRHARLDAVEMAAWRAFLTASICVTGRLDRQLESEAGISMHEYEILVRLSEAPERRLRMSELAEDVSYSRSRLSHTVARLEAAGYVQRSSCPSDKRGVNCELTGTGGAYLRQAAPIHLRGVREHLIDHFDRDQLVSLAALLSILCDTREPQRDLEP